MICFTILGLEVSSLIYKKYYTVSGQIQPGLRIGYISSGALPLKLHRIRLLLLRIRRIRI